MKRRVVNLTTGDETLVDMTAEEAEALDAERAAWEAKQDSEISAKRFRWLMAITGLDDVWSGVEAWAAVNDREIYAMLRANSAASVYSLRRVLGTLAVLKSVTDAVAPGVDLSEETIRAAWAQAETAAI